jgi:hypothetical protein
LNTIYSDDERKTILDSFMRELYFKDKDAIMNNTTNIFTIKEIWQAALYSYDYSNIENEIKEISNKQESDIEFMGKIEEGRIRLTERGRNKFIGL